MVAITPKTPAEIGHPGEELAMLLGLGHINEEHGYIPEGATVHLYGPLAVYPVAVTDDAGNIKFVQTGDQYQNWSVATRTLVRWIGWSAARRLRRVFNV